MMNGMAFRFLSLSFSSPSYNFLSLTLTVFLSPYFHPSLTPLGTSAQSVAAMCFKLK